LSKLRNISGEECIKILCNKFGFAIIRQKGGHVVLKKEFEGKTIGTVVPVHPILKRGTLKGILELAKIKEEEFEEYI
jgi:predicted RNA binding protein YcfA (HicA-like mRNA interferase family)